MWGSAHLLEKETVHDYMREKAKVKALPRRSWLICFWMVWFLFSITEWTIKVPPLPTHAKSRLFLKAVGIWKLLSLVYAWCAALTLSCWWEIAPIPCLPACCCSLTCIDCLNSCTHCCIHHPSQPAKFLFTHPERLLLYFFFHGVFLQSEDSLKRKSVFKWWIDGARRENWHCTSERGCLLWKTLDLIQELCSQLWWARKDWPAKK